MKGVFEVFRSFLLESLVIKLIITVVGGIVIVPVTFVLGVLGIVFSIFSKRLAHYVEKLYFNVILFLSFTKVDVVGLENISKGKDYVVISNHQSAFDIVVLSARLPLQIRWVSKESVFKIPIIGQFMKAMGYISIPRENLKKSVESVKFLKNLDGSPTIFPEGTRSEDGKLQKFKKGFLVIAQNTGLDLLPVVIKGSIKVMKKGSILVNPFVKVEVTVLPPIENSKVISNDNILDEIMEMYRKYLES